MNIKVLIAFSNALFSEGIRKLLENERNLDVEILKDRTKCTLEALRSLNPGVILTDLTTLYNALPVAEGADYRIILFDTDCGKDNIISAVLKKKINGLLLGEATPALLKQSIKAVASGEVWIDKTTVKDILQGIKAVSKGRASGLSEREKEIVSLIGQGFRNKEIAHKLNIGEPTVKTHLHRIFQKLDVKNRSQLITYAIKNSDLGNKF